MIRTIPISKTVSIVFWIATTHSNKCEQNKTNDKQGFAKGKPELGFSIELDRKKVEQAVELL